MKKKRLVISILAAVTVAFFVRVVIFCVNDGIETVASIKKEKVPTVEITLNGTSLDEINAGDKSTKYYGNEVTFLIGDEKLSFSDVEIKGRGNSTWDTDKKPYQIKLPTKVDIWDAGREKKWLLLANKFDSTHLRNDAALYLMGMLESDYAPEGNFVELYVDSEYIGLYYLTEKTEIGKNRINLKDENGILVEIENLHGEGETCYETRMRNCLIVKDLVVDDNEKVAMEEFLESFNALELAAAQGDYDKVMELADVESLAKYYLTSEFSVNPDAYVSSFYFYKDNKDMKNIPGFNSKLFGDDNDKNNEEKLDDEEDNSSVIQNPLRDDI